MIDDSNIYSKIKTSVQRCVYKVKTKNESIFIHAPTYFRISEDISDCVKKRIEINVTIK